MSAADGIIPDQNVNLNTGLNRTDDKVTNYPIPANLTIVNKQSAVAIGGGAAGDTVLVGITITKALTGTMVIAGFADSDAAAQNITWPAATPAGNIPINAINAAAALTVTCSNAADAKNVLVYWRAV